MWPQRVRLMFGGSAVDRKAEISIVRSASRTVERLARASGMPAIVGGGFLGCVLLALGAPRTVAAWYNFAAQPAIERLQAQQAPSPSQVADGIIALQNSLSWSESARRTGDLALLELVQSLALSGNDPQRKSRLAQSEQHQVESLVANPADGFGWLRLAMIRELRGASRRQIAVAVAKSLDMAPNVRALWIPRATMFFVYWLDLTSDELLAMRSQLQMVWSEDETVRLPLLQAASRTGGLPLVSWALSSNDGALREFEALKPKLTLESPR